MGQLKIIADEKNKTPLPQIGNGDSAQQSSNKISTEHCLINNNFHVYSEEIVRNLEEKKSKLIAKLNTKSVEEQKFDQQ